MLNTYLTLIKSQNKSARWRHPWKNDNKKGELRWDVIRDPFEVYKLNIIEILARSAVTVSDEVSRSSPIFY